MIPLQKLVDQDMKEENRDPKNINDIVAFWKDRGIPETNPLIVKTETAWEAVLATVSPNEKD